MIDVTALKAKYVGCPNILECIDLLDSSKDESGLAQIAKWNRCERSQTVSVFNEASRSLYTVSIDKLEEFVGKVNITLKRVRGLRA